MATAQGVFPRQNIPESEKNEKWCKENVLSILAYQSYTTKFNRERKKDYENYLIFNGVFDTKTFEYITNTYGISSPARLVNFPIISPKIEVIIGEFMANPINFTAEAVNEDAKIRKMDKLVSKVTEDILKPIRKEIEKELGISFEEEEIDMELPEDVAKWDKMNLREAIEEITHYGLHELIKKYDLKHVFKQGLYDQTITAKEFYHVGIKNRDPSIRRVDPRALIYDISSNSESLQDSAWVAEERFLQVNEVIDEFGEMLSVDQVTKIEKLRYEGQDSFQRYNKPYQWYYRDDSTSPMRIRVVTAVWKSLRTMKFKISPNKHDPEVPFKKVMPDDYKPKRGEKIEKKVITDIWTTTMIGHEILVDARRSPNQPRKEENYSYAPLPYVGIIKNNIDGITLSLVDSLKNIQLLYNIVMFHIELTLARAGGKAVVYDMSQKPNDISLEDVFYHAKNSGIIPINTKQEGNQVGSFNQFQQIDFTLSNSVQQLINLKSMLEQTAVIISGISPSREGLNTTETVGVNERNVVQSTLITQTIMANHSRTIGMAFQYAADLMKFCWKDGKKIRSFLGDYGAKLFEVTKDLWHDDIAIHVEHSTKEISDKEKMLQWGREALSAGQTDWLSMIKIINADTAKEAEVILERGFEEIKKSQEQQQAMQQQAMQAEQEAKAAETQMEAQKEQQSNQTKLEIAKINAEALLESTRLKIDGGQETQDFRQQHEKNMSMLGSSNEMGKKAQQVDLENASKEIPEPPPVEQGQSVSAQAIDDAEENINKT